MQWDDPSEFPGAIPVDHPIGPCASSWLRVSTADPDRFDALDRRARRSPGVRAPREPGLDAVAISTVRVATSSSTDERSLPVRCRVSSYSTSPSSEPSMGSPVSEERADEPQAAPLHHAARPRVDRHRLRPDSLRAELRERGRDQRHRSFGREPLAPRGSPQPVSELSIVLGRRANAEPADEVVGRSVERHPAMAERARSVSSTSVARGGWPPLMNRITSGSESSSTSRSTSSGVIGRSHTSRSVSIAPAGSTVRPPVRGRAQSSS